ncbi:MAG: NAD(P)-dependent oxidoreductase [Kiritimatiellae bacterium]|nr:NAD(P)-dependent oxidoreductase [Kiritimatiellia bacterium]
MLVTGAAGFLGRHVVDVLLAEGAAVTVLQGPGDPSQDMWTRCARVVSGDVCDPHAQADALADVQGVCHLAAYIPQTHTDHSATLRCHLVNADATLNLALRAAAAGVRRFVFASAGNMYAPSDRPCREEDPLFPVGPASGYLASKLTAEVYLNDVMRRTGLDVTVLRIGTPYGPGEPSRKVIPSFLRLAASGGPLHIKDGGGATYNFIYVEDVARCLASVLQMGPRGVFNVAAGESTSLLDLARHVSSIYGDRKVAIQVAQSLSPHPDRGFPPVSTDKARRMLGLRARPLAEGLTLYREWLERNGAGA